MTSGTCILLETVPINDEGSNCHYGPVELLGQISSPNTKPKWQCPSVLVYWEHWPASGDELAKGSLQFFITYSLPYHKQSKLEIYKAWANISESQVRSSATFSHSFLLASSWKVYVKAQVHDRTSQWISTSTPPAFTIFFLYSRNHNELIIISTLGPTALHPLRRMRFKL